MNIEQFYAVLIPIIAAPVSVLVVGYWIKTQMRKVDQISTILIDLQYIKEKQVEIKIELNKFNQVRDEQILLKSEVKTQWRRLDEIKERLLEV